MINNISTWAEQIIVSVIIATIIEMILPKGNSKKYIKTVIGIYILYTIISPVITFIGGKDLKIDYSKYEKYFENNEEYKVLEKEIASSTTNTIKDTYTKELEKQISLDLEELDINLESIDLSLDLETGEINNLTLTLNKGKETKDKNEISVNRIEIGSTKDKKILSMQEIDKVKNILKEKYNIDYEKITIISI